jgi:hypothetical protein
MFALIFPLGYAWDLAFSGLAALAGVLSIPALRSARPPVRVVLPLVALVVWALVSMSWSRAAVDVHKLHKYADIEKLTGMKLVLQLGLYGALVAAAQRISPRGAQLALGTLAVALTLLALAVFGDALQGAAAYAWISARVGQHIPPDIAKRNIAQGDYVIMLFFWCAAVRASQTRWPLLSLITIGCAVGSSLFLHAVDATLAAFALSLVAFVLVRSTRIVGVVVLSLATTVYWILAPLAVLVGVHDGLIRTLRPLVQLSWEERLGPGRQPHLWFGHFPAHPRRGHPGLARTGRRGRGAGGGVLDRGLDLDRDGGPARPDRRRRGLGYSGGLSDYRRPEFRRLAGVVAGPGRHGRGGLRLPCPRPVRSPHHNGRRTRTVGRRLSPGLGPPGALCAFARTGQMG